MDLHIYYRHMFKLNDEVQGFNITYDEDNNEFGKLIEFIQRYPDRDVNIRYKNGIDPKSASALAKIGDNVYFRLEGQDIHKAGRLRENGCKFFFDKTCAVSSYWELEYMVERVGVDSIYIVDDLCYNLEKVSRYCHEHGVRLRVVLNRCATRFVHDDKRITYYRPQDMGYLEGLYDIAEFECGEGINGFNANLCEVLHKRFFVKRDWYGNLRELNPSLPFDAYNRQLPLKFVERRSTCQLRCLQEGSSCHHCELIHEVMRTLLDNGMQLSVKPKKVISDAE